MNLIYDKAAVWGFFQKMLETLPHHMVYLMLGIARKKYEPTLVKSSQIVLDRKILKTTQQEALEKVIVMDNALRENYFKNEEVPKNAKAIYVTVTPCDAMKAWFELMKTGNQYLHDFIANPDLTKTPMRSIDNKWFGALQATGTKGRYLVIDLDNKEGFDSVLEKLDLKKVRHITETRGGYHFFVERDSDTSKQVFTEVKFLPDVEITRHGMTPIVGTLQGGFEVKEVEL